MRSIRKRLVLWLLLGLAVLWATAGAGVYYSVRKGELARLDARLDTLANGVRFYGSMLIRDRVRERPRPETDAPAPPDRATRPDRPEGDSRRRSSSDRWPQFFQEDGREYFSIAARLPSTTVAEASKSLGANTLDVPQLTENAEPSYYDKRLPDGTRIRAMSFRFPTGFGRGRPRPSDPSDPGPRPNIDAVVAVDAEPMRATLTTLLFGITGIGCIAALASVGLIHFALKDGLKPLDQLGDQLADIDAESLDGRFSNKSMPTELAPICDRLNALMGRLETSFERERRFSADLAHELRTPVAELRTMAEVALRWPDGADREQSEQTLEIAEQMGGIIESLLALGRFENGQAEAEPETIDLAEFAATCWKPFSATTTDKDITTTLDLPPGRTLETDPKMLRLIITNLFSNAAEYTPNGGRIEIAARTGQLTVTNDAPLLDAEKASHIFERFWRADGSRTDGSHSGLGLSLARTCAQATGLGITAKHEAGRLSLTVCEESSGASSSDNLARVE